MNEISIRCFYITLFSFYIYIKLLNLDLKPKHNLLMFFFSSLMLSGFVTYLKISSPYINLICMNVLFIVIITLYTKTGLRISIITSVISSGICHSVFVISTVIGSIIFVLLRLNDTKYRLVLLLFIGFIEAVILVLIFRTKRLRNGMPFLTEPAADNIGITISALTLCCIAILYNNDAQLIFMIPVALIIIGIIFILIWWQRWLTRTYLNRKRDAELIELHKTVEEKDKHIEQLKQQNIIFGNLIHKDNKLIPAMELAVTGFLKSYKDKDADEIEAIAQHILADLKKQSAGRRDILENIDTEVKQLPQTGVTSVDTLLTYLAKKAAKFHVTIDLTVHASIKYMTQNVIDENDLNTLFAEMIDNSIISASQNEVRKVLIILELVESIYVINIFDSGDPFASEVLKNIGIKSITTRGDTGGSGIGLVNIFEIIKKYEASFIIDDMLSSNNIFTKKIAVWFDRKNKYILRSNRADISKILSSRTDIIVDNNPR